MFELGIGLCVPSWPRANPWASIVTGGCRPMKFAFYIDNTLVGDFGQEPHDEMKKFLIPLCIGCA